MRVKAYYKDLDEVLHSIGRTAEPDTVEVVRVSVHSSLVRQSKDAGRWLFRVPVLLCIQGGKP